MGQIPGTIFEELREFVKKNRYRGHILLDWDPGIWYVDILRSEFDFENHIATTSDTDLDTAIRETIRVAKAGLWRETYPANDDYKKERNSRRRT